MCAAREGPRHIDLRLHPHVAARPARLARGVAHVGLALAGGQHDLLDSLADLLLAAAVAGGQLAHRAVDIGLAPEHARAVVEEVEVVRVVSLLLHDLELDVLVVQVGIERGGVGVGKTELAGEEEARDLPGAQVVAELEPGAGALERRDVLVGVGPAAGAELFRLPAFGFPDALLLKLPLGDEGLAGLFGDDPPGKPFGDLHI